MRYCPDMNNLQLRSVLDVNRMTRSRIAVGLAILLLSACGSESVRGSSSSQNSVQRSLSAVKSGGVKNGLASVNFTTKAAFPDAVAWTWRRNSVLARDLNGHQVSLTNSRLCAAFVQRNSPPYKLCDKGPGIRRLQQILYEYGLLVPEDGNPVDGYFGSTTEDAVRAYQSRSGLSVNGVVEETWFRQLRDDYQRGGRTANPATTVPSSRRNSGSSIDQGSCKYFRSGVPTWAPDGSQKKFSDGVNECRDGSWVVIAPTPRPTKSVVGQTCSTRPTGMSSSWHGVMYSYSIYDVWSDGSKTLRSGGMAYGDQLPSICW